MKITLFDINQDLCNQWEKDFAEIKGVSVFYGDFDDVPPHQCIVSPANSFGIMDGGFDLVLRDYFGMKIEYGVQAAIKKRFGGISPLGSCTIVETGDGKFPCLAHVPTMFYPMAVNKTANVFFAFRALLFECVEHGIESVACNGLGGLTGQLSPEQLSLHMKTAYTTFHTCFEDWDDVHKLLRKLSGDQG